MQSSIISSSRRGYVVPALLLGTAFFIATTYSAHAMTSAEQFAQMESQLKAASQHLTELQMSRQSGLVLGVSTMPPVPVRPVCSLNTDKNVYKLGDSIKVSWSTTGTKDVKFITRLEGTRKDNLTYPVDALSLSGSVPVKALILGLPAITILAESITGHRSICTKTVVVTDESAGKADSRIAFLQAKIIASSKKINKIETQQANLNKKFWDEIYKQFALLTEIEKLQGSVGPVAASGTSAWLKGEYIGSKQTLNSNNLETVLDDVGIFSLTVALTATNDDVYIPKIAQRAGFGGVMGISYVTQDQTTGKATALGKASASLTSSAQVSGNFYKIVEGTTENFTVTVNYDPAAAGTFKVQLVNVFFNTKPVNPDVNNFSNNILLPKPNGFDRGYYSEALVI